jgi:hypothetical protein
MVIHMISRPGRQAISAQSPGGFTLEFLIRIRRFSSSDWALELMHETLSNINKSKRERYSMESLLAENAESLRPHDRRGIAAKHSQVALPPRSVEESQHCS